MLSRKNYTDEELISRYTDQPGSMPRIVRDAIETAWNGQLVQLYALADLDASLKLARTWIALGSKDIAIVSEDGAEVPKVRSYALEEVETVRETPGLSCTRLTLSGKPDEPPLAVLRYSQRQRRAVENIRFILEERIKGRLIEHESDSDEAYRDALTYSIKEAQSSVAAGKMTVV